MYLFTFVETPGKYIIINTIINLRGVSRKINKYFCFVQCCLIPVKSGILLCELGRYEQAKQKIQTEISHQQKVGTQKYPRTCFAVSKVSYIMK